LAAVDIYRKHHAMKSFLRNLPVPAEFCLVILIAFGLPMCMVALHLIQATLQSTHLSSIPVFRELFAHYGTRAAPHSPHFSNASLLGVVVYELVVLAVVFSIGYIRNWSFRDFGFQFSWAWLGVGVLLFVIATMVYELVLIWGSFLAPGAGGAWPSPSASRLALPFIILNSLTNPVFEEVLEAGYVIRTLRGCGMWVAVLGSALLRCLLHAHLGAPAAAAIFGIGVVFGLAYWRWRQLLPLIVAHGCMNLCAFLYFNHSA
jgi:membrane protease YdiL (CAAX protease family)